MMFRTLSIVAVAGLILSAVCIAGAAALAGPDLAKNGWSFPDGPGWFSVSWDDDHGPQATRDIAWSADHELVFTSGGEVHFKQGAEHKMTVTGPADVLGRLRMQNGRLTVDGGHLPGDLKIEVTAPDIESFKMLGDTDLTIDGFAGDKLSVEVDGDGSVTAAGKAKRIDVVVNGSGDVDASGLAADEAHVQVTGSGDARVAPRQAADIAITGSGDVTLATNPARVTSNVTGSGSLIQDASPAPATPEGRRS